MPKKVVNALQICEGGSTGVCLPKEEITPIDFKIEKDDRLFFDPDGWKCFVQSTDLEEGQGVLIYSKKAHS